jgi:hypothetical protein
VGESENCEAAVSHPGRIKIERGRTIGWEAAFRDFLLGPMREAQELSEFE